MYEMCQGKAQHTLLHIMLRYDKNETRSLRDWTMHKWFKHEILMPVKYKIAIQCPRASKEIQQFCKDIFYICVFYDMRNKPENIYGINRTTVCFYVLLFTPAGKWRQKFQLPFWY